MAGIMARLMELPHWAVVLAEDETQGINSPTSWNVVYGKPLLC